jgi:hypothetical protein
MDDRRVGAFAAFSLPVLEIAFGVYGGLVGVRLVTDRPDPAADLAKVVANTVLMSGQGTIRALSGVTIILLVLVLHGRLQTAAPYAMRVGTAAALMGGGLFITEGVGTLAVYDELAKVDGVDHSVAVAAYAALGAVILLLNTAGRAMFGVFVLICSVVASRNGVISRPLLYVSMLFGIALIGGHVTGLSPLSGALNIVMGLLLIVWPVWIGITLLRGRPTSSPAVAGTTSGASLR